MSLKVGFVKGGGDGCSYEGKIWSDRFLGKSPEHIPEYKLSLNRYSSGFKFSFIREIFCKRCGEKFKRKVKVKYCINCLKNHLYELDKDGYVVKKKIPYQEIIRLRKIGYGKNKISKMLKTNVRAVYKADKMIANFKSL